MTWGERVKGWLSIFIGGSIVAGPRVPKGLKPPKPPKTKPKPKPKPKPDPSKPTQTKPDSIPKKDRMDFDWLEDIAESIGGKGLKGAVKGLRSESSLFQLLGALALFLFLVMFFRED